MLHIILFILKIIGILLLLLIGIVFTILLIVLFVPIRYRIAISKYDTMYMKIFVSWFLRSITYCQIYNENKMTVQIRMFGFVIKDSENPKTKKRIKKKTKRNKKANGTFSKNRSNSPKKKRDSEGDIEIAQVNPHNLDIDNNSQKDYSLNPISYPPTVVNLDKMKKKGFIGKIRAFLIKIKTYFIQTIEFFKKIKTSYLNIIATKQTIFHKIHVIRDYLKKEEHKLGIKKVWWGIKRLVKCVFPKKLKANIHFGTGDPCSTGKVLGVIGLTYHLYQKNVNIMPNFTEEIYEGDVFAKSKIHLFTILITGIQVILDKNVRQLMKELTELKEEF